MCFDSTDINKVCDSWTSTFLNVARQCIPNRVITVRPCDKTFFTPELRKLRRKKNRCHRKAKQSINDPSQWTKFREIRNVYNAKLKSAKADAEKRDIMQLKDHDNVNVKRWWRIAKSFIQKDTKTCIPPIRVDNEVICDDQMKAESFNDFFLQHSTLDVSGVPTPSHTPVVGNTLSTITITTKDVADLLNCLNVNKASGPDMISHAMLKMAGNCIVAPLTRLFNLSLTTSTFPTIWKRANVVPIFKKNDVAIRDNYRPISLLSCVGKLFERSVFKYVFNFLRYNNAISLKQSGFMPGDSTVYQLAHLYHIFSEALDKQKDI